MKKSNFHGRVIRSKDHAGSSHLFLFLCSLDPPLTCRARGSPSHKNKKQINVHGDTASPTFGVANLTP